MVAQAIKEIHTQPTGLMDEYDTILRCYLNQIFNYSLFLTGSYLGAEQVTQKVMSHLFVELVLNEASPKPEISVYKLATRFTAEWLQNDGAEVEKEHDLNDLFPKGSLGDSVAHGLDLLPFEYKSVFILRDVRGLSVERISSILDLSYDEAIDRLHHARMMVKRWAKKIFSAEVKISENILANDKLIKDDPFLVMHE